MANVEAGAGNQAGTSTPAADITDTIIISGDADITATTPTITITGATITTIIMTGTATEAAAATGTDSPGFRR